MAALLARLRCAGSPAMEPDRCPRSSRGYERPERQLRRRAGEVAEFPPHSTRHHRSARSWAGVGLGLSAATPDRAAGGTGAGRVRGTGAGRQPSGPSGVRNLEPARLLHPPRPTCGWNTSKPVSGPASASGRARRTTGPCGCRDASRKTRAGATPSRSGLRGHSRLPGLLPQEDGRLLSRRAPGDSATGVLLRRLGDTRSRGSVQGAAGLGELVASSRATGASPP
jgi:hypothetical protein